MTRLLYLPDDATIIHLEVDIPSRQLAAAVNAGLEPLPKVFTPGQRYTARLVGNTVIVFPHRKVEKLTGENYNSALTQKQRRVLELAMKGFSNLQIAELMGISKRTVAYHMKGIKSLIQPRKITGMVKGMDE